MNATVTATWKGTWREGAGTISTATPTIKSAPSTYASRFEGKPGASPEELLAASIAGCYNQAIANSIVLNGFEIEHVDTAVKAVMAVNGPHGHPIVERLEIEVVARIPGIPREKFDVAAEKARVHCSILEILKLDPILSATLIA